MVISGAVWFYQDSLQFFMYLVEYVYVCVLVEYKHSTTREDQSDGGLSGIRPWRSLITLIAKARLVYESCISEIWG